MSISAPQSDAFGKRNVAAHWHEWFDTTFWPRYPRREKKIAARDAMKWAMQNHNGDGCLMAKIEAALVWQLECHPEWRYWTTPDRWLLAQRWTDEPPLRQAELSQQRAEAVRQQMREDAQRRKALPDLAERWRAS